MTSRRGLTVACVYNDLSVRQDCLDRSVALMEGEAPVEYLPIDNRDRQFASAGAALNHAARQASHDVLVLCHQDVYLHSYERLAAAADELRSGTWGLLGAHGVAADDRRVGRLRDRVLLLGESAPTPQPVDSLDEVLFMATREQLLTSPLSEDLDLSWHAYAVEYGLRARALGLRVGAVDLAITHNSLTINLERLVEAHQRVAALHNEQLPVRTTVGVVDGRRLPRLRNLPGVRKVKWRWTWLQESRTAATVGHVVPWPRVLANITTDVDELPSLTDERLLVVNVDTSNGFAEHAGAPVSLKRRGRRVDFQVVRRIGDLPRILEVRPDDTSVLVTDLTLSGLTELASKSAVPGSPGLVGIHGSALWLLVGPDAAAMPRRWNEPRALPLTVGSRRFRG